MTFSSPSLSPVLITGGCGFIGSHLIEHLHAADQSCEIHVLDNDISRNILPSVKYHKYDISSADAVDLVMQEVRPRTIFHIACPDSMIVVPELFDIVNVGGTRNLLASAAKIGTVQAFVFTSTSSVIHDNRSDLIDADETLPILRPPYQQRVYTLTKATAEEDIIAANRKEGDHSMLTACLRPCTAIGERDTICLGKMIPRAEEGKMKFQMGNGRNIYDFIYVGNLVDGHILAAQALVKAYGKPSPPAAQRVDGETFNLTNDENVLFWEFARKVAAAAGHPVKNEEIVVIPAWVGLFMAWCSEWIAWLRGTRQSTMSLEAVRFSTINRTLDIDKAKRVLGYRPSVSIDEGIRRGVVWYTENREIPK